MDRTIRDLIKRVEALEALVASPIVYANPEIAEITKDMAPDPNPYRAQHVGRGRYAVIGPDGLRVNPDYYLDKPGAESLAAKRNASAERNAEEAAA